MRNFITVVLVGIFSCAVGATEVTPNERLLAEALVKSDADFVTLEAVLAEIDAANNIAQLKQAVAKLAKRDLAVQRANKAAAEKIKEKKPNKEEQKP